MGTPKDDSLAANFRRQTRPALPTNIPEDNGLFTNVIDSTVGAVAKGVGNAFGMYGDAETVQGAALQDMVNSVTPTGAANGRLQTVSSQGKWMQDEQVKAAGARIGIDTTSPATAAGGAAMLPLAATMAAFETGYHVMNTIGASSLLLANAPAIAANLMKPGDNFHMIGPLVGGVGTLGGQELNPELQDGFQWNDITNTIKNVWDKDVTIGEVGMLTVGRTLDAPFWDSKGDEKIIEESINWRNDVRNDKGLYASNIGLSSTFNLWNDRQRDSATNQGWGRFISGGIDAAVAWWLGPDVIGAKIIGRAYQTATTTLLTKLGSTDEIRVAFAEGAEFSASNGVAGRKNQIYDLMNSLAKMPKQYVAEHDIARLSTEPSLVADVLGGAKTPEEVLEGVLALGGDQTAIAAIGARSKIVQDTLTTVQREKAAIDKRLFDVGTIKLNKGTDLPQTMTRWTAYEDELVAEAGRLQDVLDEAMKVNKNMRGWRGIIDDSGEISAEVRLTKLPVGDTRTSMAFEKAARLEAKATKRVDRITGDNLWRATSYKVGGKYGRTVRMLHAGADYVRTTKIKGIARVNDAKDTIEEITSAVTTNPLLRKLSREAATEFPTLGDGTGWMPGALKALRAKRDEMTPEAWDAFINNADEFGQWKATNRVQTAREFRNEYHLKVTDAIDERTRIAIIEDFEKRMFMDMSGHYGMAPTEAAQVLGQYNYMKNKVAEQVRERKWFKDPESDDIIMAPQLASELAQGYPLLDFQFMDRIFRINGGGATGVRASVGMNASRFAATVDAIWRPLVLLRLGYTIRNVTESNLRSLAYYSTVPQSRSLGRDLMGEDANLLNLFSNSFSRLERTKNFVVTVGTMGPKGTKARLSKAYDAEAALLAERRSLQTSLQTERASVAAEQQALRDRLSRAAAIKAGIDRAKRKAPGESNVWEKIEAGVQRRMDFYSRIDLIHMDAENVSLAENTGIFAHDYDMNVLKTSGSPTVAMMKAQPQGAEMGDWQRWLTNDDFAAVGDIATADIDVLRFRALANFMDHTQGSAGFPVRITDLNTSQYEIIKDVEEWGRKQVAEGLSPKQAFGQVYWVPAERINSIKGARVQVGGGVLDLRPRGGDFRELQRGITYDDLWERVFSYDTHVQTPKSLYPNMPFISDNYGGFGKFHDAIGYMKVNRLHEIAEAHGENELFEGSTQAWGDANLSVLDWGRTTQDQLSTMDSPIVVDLLVEGDGSSIQSVPMMVSDGLKRIRGAYQSGLESAYVPVVFRVNPHHGFDSTYDFVSLHLGDESKGYWLGNRRAEASINSYDQSIYYVNPRNFSDVQAWSSSHLGRKIVEQADAGATHLDTVAAELGAVRDYNKPMSYMLDTARAFRAAELNPQVMEQLQLRLADVSEPRFKQWLVDEGHIMPDEVFRKLIDETVPADSMTSPEALASAIHSLDSYVGHNYSVNAEIAEGNTVSESLVQALDWATQSATKVQVEPLRVIRLDDTPEYTLMETPSPKFTSVMTGEVRTSVPSGSTPHVVYLQPGVPYVSMEKSIARNWEEELLLPRGMRFVPTGTTENVNGHWADVYEATWDKADVPDVFPDGLDTMSNRTTNKYVNTFVNLRDKTGGQLGGYTYGTHSGVWDDGWGYKYYVKDYEDEVQSLVESFVDEYIRMTGAAYTRRGRMGYAEGRWVYATDWDESTKRITLREALDSGKMENAADRKQIAEDIARSFGTDALLMNYDSLGPALENVWVRRDDIAFGSIFKYDNGASLQFRAHGGKAAHKTPDADLFAMLDHPTGWPEILKMSGLSVDEFKTIGYQQAYTQINKMIKGGTTPGNWLTDYYTSFLSNNMHSMDNAAIDSWLALGDDVKVLAEFMNDRAESVLKQAIDSGLLDEYWVKEMEGSLETLRLARTSPGPTPMAPHKPFLEDGRAMSEMVNSIDDPIDIAEGDVLAKFADMYGRENGVGKVIVPGRSKARPYTVRVNPDQVYNGGDNIDNTPAGWMTESIAENGGVLDLRNASEDMIEHVTGLNRVEQASLHYSEETPRSMRARLAIAMENTGNLHIVMPDGKKYSASELIGTADAGAAYGAAVAADEVEARVQAMMIKSKDYQDYGQRIADLDSRLARVGGEVGEREAALQVARDNLAKRMTTRELGYEKKGKRLRDAVGENLAGQKAAVYRGGLEGETLPFTVRKTDAEGNVTVEQGKAKVPGSFEGHGSYYQQLASSESRVAADLQGLADVTYRGLRRTQSDQVYQPYTQNYFKELANYANTRVGNDFIGRQMLQGMDDETIMRALFETTEGRATIRKLDDFIQFRGKVSEDILTDGLRDDLLEEIGRRRQMIQDYFGNETVLQALADGKQITGDFLRFHIGANPNLKPFEGKAYEVESNLVKRGTQTVMHWLGSAPEDKLARHPFFRDRYRESMMSQLQRYADQGMDEFSAAQIETMARIARKEALQQINDTLYTIQRVSTAAEMLRFIVPFFPAWSSAMKFWLYQIPRERPENLVRYMQADGAADRVGWTVDKDNKKIQGTSNLATLASRKLLSSESSSIVFSVPKTDIAWFDRVIGPQGNVKVPKGSIDMMLQGDFPVLPTSTPFVSVPATWVAAMKPDLTTQLQGIGKAGGGDYKFTLGGKEFSIEMPKVELGKTAVSRVVPFGEPTREKDFLDAATDAYAPAWAKKLIINVRGESSAEFVSTAQEIQRSQMTDWDLAGRPAGQEPKYSDALAQARDFYTFRGLVNVGAPFSPIFQSKYQFYIDAWRSIDQDGMRNGLSYDERVNKFIGLYGEPFFRYTKSKSGTSSGVAPDLGEYEAVTKYEDLAGKLANYGGTGDAKFVTMLSRPFNTEQGFNGNVYSWQMNRPIPGAPGKYFRGGAQATLLEDDVRSEEGWRYYTQQVTELETLAEQRGSSDAALTAAKGQLRDWMAQQDRYQGWYADFQSIEGGRWVDSVNAVQDMLNDPAFAKDFAPPAGAEYKDMNTGQQYYWALSSFMDLRENAIQRLEYAAANGGSANIEAKSNAALKRAYDRAVMDLGEINGDFGDMHKRFFSSDKLKRTAEVVAGG